MASPVPGPWPAGPASPARRRPARRRPATAAWPTPAARLTTSPGLCCRHSGSGGPAMTWHGAWPAAYWPAAH